MNLRYILALFMVAFLLSGCAPKETVAPPKTVAEIDAEIKKVQDDPNMPPQAKGLVLGNLQKTRAQAAKTAGGK